MDKQKRKRGIKASRSKLETAMLAVGFKTQSALAEQIARQENLEAPPKDLINRAFRQENVSPQTIARMAKALKVEAYQLYLSKNEQEQIRLTQNPKPSVPSLTNHSAVTFSNRRLLILLCALLLVVSIGWVINYQLSPPNRSTPSTNSADTMASFKTKKLSLVVRQIPDKLMPITQSLKANLDGDIRAILLASPIDTIPPSHLMSLDIAEKYQSDAVMTLRSMNYGRHIGVQYFLFYQGQETLLWTETSTQLELEQRPDMLVNRAIEALNQSLNINHSKQLAQPLIDSSEQKKYLKARHLLDDYQSEINLRRAEGLLISATENAPKYAKAYAALCESRIRLSWMGEEKNMLDDAQSACDTAKKLDPGEAYQRSTLAFLYRRTGRVKESIALYSDILQLWPNHSISLAGLASSAFEAHQQGIVEFPGAINLALQKSIEATRLEPTFWQYQSMLANIYFIKGDLNAAIEVEKRTVELKPNELSLVNLGFFQLCKGVFKEARSSFLQAQQIAPNSYLGKEYLGLAYYFLHQYQNAAELRQEAIDLINQDDEVAIHQMWGNLADAYRLAKFPQQASNAYLQAYEIVDRDQLRGNASIADKVYRLYYYLQLNQQLAKEYPLQRLNLNPQTLDDFLTSELGPSGFIKLAQVYQLINDKEHSNQSLNKALKTCPGFANYPELERSKVHSPNQAIKRTNL